jgi:hypothetical protein
MSPIQFVKPAGALAAVALLGLAGMLITSPRVQADSDESDSRVQIGLKIAPVKLNMKGLNPELVGKGSYIVNAQGDCNGCHGSPDLGPEFSPGGNPFFNQHPTVINPASYLGGGRTFAVIPNGTPHPAVLQSRNLTPDKSGLPEGGHTFQEFLTILRTGHDLDGIHPTCPAAPPAGSGSGCLPAVVGDGALLQIMPWPIQANMSDGDIRAIYEYLRAIPCVAHAPGAISVPASGGNPAVPVLPGVFNTCK